MDAFQVEIRERLTRIEARLEERCANSFARLDSLEKSTIRQGERIGKLEAHDSRRKGAMAVVAVLTASVGAIGAAAVKFWQGGH
jgi:hypothetical protein